MLLSQRIAYLPQLQGETARITSTYWRGKYGNHWKLFELIPLIWKIWNDYQLIARILLYGIHLLNRRF